MPREPNTKSTRMATRTRNATVHPGHVVMESTRARRSKEEIQQEKESKQAAKEAKEKKKIEKEARIAAAQVFIAQCEQEQKTTIDNATKEFPRHQTARMPAEETTKAAKRKAVHDEPEKTEIRKHPTSRVATNPVAAMKAAKKKQSASGPHLNNNDADSDTPPSPKPKRVKVDRKKPPPPLRRRETSLSMVLDSESESADGGFIAPERPMTSDDVQVLTEDEEATPRPAKKKPQVLEDSDEPDENFRTPRTLRRDKIQAKPLHFSSDLSDLSDVEELEVSDSEESTKLMKVKGKERRKDTAPVTIKERTQHVPIPAIDFSSLSRPTTSNPIIKAGAVSTSKPTASKAIVTTKSTSKAKPTSERTTSKNGASQRTASKNGASQPTTSKNSASQHPTSKSSASQHAVSSGGSQSAIEHQQEDGSSDEHAIGGMHDEDDSLEKEAVMSSPMKGSELRATRKLLKATRKVDDDTRARRRATIQDLPFGPNERHAWMTSVLPNFLRLVMAGDQPWFIGDDVIISNLQTVWNAVYGQKIPVTIEKGTAPFEIAQQRLYDYRSKLASHAIETVYLYLWHQRDDEGAHEISVDELATKAGEMLTDRSRYIFSGMTDNPPTKTGTFRHPLITETLVLQFTKINHGSLINGLQIDYPLLTLALAIAAVVLFILQIIQYLINIFTKVERALELFANKMVEQRIGPKGKPKTYIRKSHDPNTGVLSTMSTEFSAAGWNKATLEYFKAIKQLGEKKLKVIFDSVTEIIQDDGLGDESEEEPSGRATLCSD